MKPLEHDLALLTFSHRDQRNVYWAKAARNAHPFLSASAVLIQGIYEQNPEMARKILRERIYTSAPMTDSQHAMIKVCAKRITVNVPVEELERRIPNEAIEVEAPLSQREFAKPPARAPMDQARWLAQTVTRENEALYLNDRAIGAVLLSKEGKLLAYAVNTNSRNRFCHAEINLLFQLHAQGENRIPSGASFYVTLKPCRMCAAMILDFCEDPSSIRVFYDEDDPGPNARRTVLDLSPYPIQEQLKLAPFAGKSKGKRDLT